jgi:hypothetical protein
MRFDCKYAAFKAVEALSEGLGLNDPAPSGA